MPKKNWSIVTDGIYLYSKRENDSHGNPKIQYEVECAQNKQLSFEIDISLSQNFQFVNTTERTVHALVGPYQRQIIAHLVPIDSTKRSLLKIKYKWSLSSVTLSEEEIKKQLLIKDAITEVRRSVLI